MKESIEMGTQGDNNGQCPYCGKLGCEHWVYGLSDVGLEDYRQTLWVEAGDRDGLKETLYDVVQGEGVEDFPCPYVRLLDDEVLEGDAFQADVVYSSMDLYVSDRAAFEAWVYKKFGEPAWLTSTGPVPCPYCGKHELECEHLVYSRRETEPDVEEDVREDFEDDDIRKSWLLHELATDREQVSDAPCIATAEDIEAETIDEDSNFYTEIEGVVYRLYTADADALLDWIWDEIERRASKREEQQRQHQVWLEERQREREAWLAAPEGQRHRWLEENTERARRGESTPGDEVDIRNFGKGARRITRKLLGLRGLKVFQLRNRSFVLPDDPKMRALANAVDKRGDTTLAKAHLHAYLTELGVPVPDMLNPPVREAA